MMKAATGNFVMSFGVAGTLLAITAVLMLVKDPINQMVQARAKAELARLAEEAAQAAALQPALDQVA